MSEMSSYDAELARIQQGRRDAMRLRSPTAAANTAKRADALADVAKRALGKTDEARPYMEEALRCRWTYAQTVGPRPGHGPGKGNRGLPLDGLDPMQRSRWRELYPLTEERLETFLRTSKDIPEFGELRALAASIATGIDPEQGDDWYTPRWLFDQLGITFDIDVCTPADPAMRTVPALRHYTEDDDGLEQPWQGIVWCNPPYSTPAPWAARWLEHGNGLLLTHIPANASWAVDVWRQAEAAVWMQAMHFERPNGETYRPGYALQLAAMGDPAFEALHRVDAPKSSSVWIRRGSPHGSVAWRMRHDS